MGAIGSAPICSRVHTRRDAANNLTPAASAWTAARARTAAGGGANDGTPRRVLRRTDCICWVVANLANRRPGRWVPLISLPPQRHHRVCVCVRVLQERSCVRTTRGYRSPRLGLGRQKHTPCRVGPRRARLVGSSARVGRGGDADPTPEGVIMRQRDSQQRVHRGGGGREGGRCSHLPRPSLALVPGVSL